MIKRRLERVAVTLLSVAMLLSSTGVAASFAANEGSTNDSTTVISASTGKTSTAVSQEGGAISSTTVSSEGGKLNGESKGLGTVSNPYIISSVSDFLAMQTKINTTTDANKYFVLTSDIDLSSVTSDDFSANSGSLISVSKSLSMKSSNVWFSLDGNGHKISGLKVTLTKADNVGIFGYINSKSVVKNILIENCVINVESDVKNGSVLAAENNGTIAGCEVKNSVLTMKNTASAGIVAAVNSGTVSNVKVTGNLGNASGASDSSHTISAGGTVGAVCGTNSGKITGVSVVNVGMFINPNISENVIYGGITGANSGTVSNSFASGNVTGGKGTDVVGGISGTVSDGAKFVNNYILVALKCSASGNGLVGNGAKQNMFIDCYWSSAISGRMSSIRDYGAGINDLDCLRFKVVKIGESTTVSSSDLSVSWGKASFKIKEGFTKSGNGITVSSGSSATVKGLTAGTVGRLNYTAEITLPSSIGGGNVRISQYFSLPVLVVSSNGKGTNSDPLEIENANDFDLLRYAHGVNAKIVKDITFKGSAFAFNGNLDGMEHTVTVSAPVFTEIFGSIKNVEFSVKKDINSAVLGKAVGISIDNVGVTVADGSRFNASGSVNGVMFSVIAGNSSIDNCRVKADATVSGNVTSFGGLAGSITGSNTSVTNSGADININGSAQSSNIAGVVGSVDGEKVSFANCYVSGANKAGKYAFVAKLSSSDVSFTKIYTSRGTQAALDFTKYPFADRSQFIEWMFDDGEVAFFTGNGGSFTVAVPSVKSMISSSVKDYSVTCDSSKLNASINIENGKIVLNVKRVSGVVTVKGSPVTITSKKTGLYTTVNISNGLEKNDAGEYIVNSPYDLAYISENITELRTAEFVVENDIDMSVISSFEPIGGTLVSFGGNFDGNGHVISGLNINGTSKVGLFASLDNAEIKNLTISFANVESKGLYSAVLAGQIKGNTRLADITILNSKISADGIYSGIIVGSVDSGNLTVNTVKIVDSSVSSMANYVGAFAGRVSSEGTIDGVNINNVKVNGAEYVAGISGIAESKIAIKNVNVSNSTIGGVSAVSGIASGKDKALISGATISDSNIYTISDSSAFSAGGISAEFGYSIENVEVRNVKVSAGIASAVVAKSISASKLSIKNVKVLVAEIKAQKANTVAAGILAVHNAGGAAIINNCYVDDKTTISSTSVASGVIGDIAGNETALSATNIKSFAQVEGFDSADAVAAAGLVGKIGASALNNSQFANIKIFGFVSGNAAAGGLIGIIKGNGSYNGSTSVISDSVCATQIKTNASNENAGIVIGSVENSRVINSTNANSFVSNTVISTYFGNIGAIGTSTEISLSGLFDMDKPNGTSIIPSTEVLTTFEETEITISNLPKVSGYTFDAETGWTSEASERIGVIKSAESNITVKANHQAEISMVGYYVSNSDSSVRIPVHFVLSSNVRTPLKGAGTSSSPYLISNAYDLESVAYYDSQDKYFVLVADISFSDEDFEFGGGFYNVGNGVVTIGSAESAFCGHFSGKYNGIVHKINGLKLSGNTFGGLFGATDGATLSDLVVNNADVSALNYAGIIVGKAKDTTIRNIVINNSNVQNEEFGSVVGILAGYSEDVTVENITIKDSSASTTLLATSATVETAGGVSGIFGGTLKNVSLDGVKISSGTVAGGFVGSATSIHIEKAEFNGSVNAKESGGIIGSLKDPLNASINNVYVSGVVNGKKIAAGAVATVGNNPNYLSKADKSLIKNTVITAKAEGETAAAVIAKVDVDTFKDTDNLKIDIFENVYYSSYQNESVFGTQEINSYQNTKFNAIDISNMKSTVGGIEKSFVTLNGDKTPLSEDQIILGAGNGTYKEFTLCGHSFTLNSVKADPEGTVIFNESDSTISAVGEVKGAKLVFTYSDGLEIAIPVNYSSLLNGSGTKSDPYRVGTADEFAVMMQNGGTADTYYILTDDISLDGISSAEKFAGELDGANHVVYDFDGTSLFATVSGTVKNTGFIGFNIDSANSVAVGAVAETLDGATIENCVVIADVNVGRKAQDVGIVAGRAVNGTKIENSLTSGKVIGTTVLAGGGLVGSANNSQISNTVSTAYVSVKGFAGGLVGEADYTVLKNSVFGNMVESTEKKSGNIAGRFASSSVAENVMFDARTAKDQVAVFEGTADSMKAASTAVLEDPAIVGYTKTSGYAVPSSLKSTENSGMFETGVEFAAMTFKYVNGAEDGTAVKYTDIKIPTEVNSNSVSVEKSNGLTVTLMKNKDFATTKNTVARYAKPMVENSVEISCSVKDFTNKLSGKLIGVMLKTKNDGTSNSLSFFTNVGESSRHIDSVNVTQSGIYIDLSLPVGYGFKVKAVDSNGKSLKITDAGNEGMLVETNDTDRVNISIEIIDSKPAWGVRSIWSVIGK